MSCERILLVCIFFPQMPPQSTGPPIHKCLPQHMAAAIPTTILTRLMTIRILNLWQHLFLHRVPQRTRPPAVMEAATAVPWLAAAAATAVAPMPRQRSEHMRTWLIRRYVVVDPVSAWFYLFTKIGLLQLLFGFFLVDEAGMQASSSSHHSGSTLATVTAAAAADANASPSELTGPNTWLQCEIADCLKWRKIPKWVPSARLKDLQKRMFFCYLVRVVEL
jgi:hypothetical protein